MLKPLEKDSGFPLANDVIPRFRHATKPSCPRKRASSVSLEGRKLRQDDVRSQIQQCPPFRLKRVFQHPASPQPVQCTLATGMESKLSTLSTTRICGSRAMR